mgnify:CR=1 FL=1
MSELRAISSRAEISPTRFCNEYQWGDLKADATKLLARYFDAHLYYANWGTRTFMMRLPKSRVDRKAWKPYFVTGSDATMRVAGAFVVLDLSSSDEDSDGDESEQAGSLAALTPLRAELLRGDMRPAYLAWLLAVQADAVEDDAIEPPVPAGLAALTSAQVAMVEFLRIDARLIAAAAHGIENKSASASEADLRRWVTGLSPAQKERWLMRAIDEPELPLGDELARAFRAKLAPSAAPARRSVAQLRAIADDLSAARDRRGGARR